MLFGKEAMQKLKQSKVAVFGVGGVGGYAVEALARSGIGALDLIDNDKVSLTNLNRQILATHSSMGKFKVDVAKERIHDIDPSIRVNACKCFFMPETAEQFDFSQYDHIIDAIDTVTGKLEIIRRAKALGVPVISSMGAGNKLDPTAFKVADIYETKVCPLAKVMRYELKRLGVKDLKVVYSEEKPVKPFESEEISQRNIPGSNAFVPSVVGLIIAGEVIKDIVRGENTLSQK